MRSTQALRSTFALAFLGVFLGGCAGAANPASRRPIVIGADLQLSGPGAAIDAVYRQALQLRIDQTNAAGGIAGRQVQLRISDNRGDAGLSVRDITAFAGDNRVIAVITGSCSECALADAAVVNRDRLPTIALAPATGVATPAVQRRYLFKLGPDADDGAVVLAGELATAKLRRVAIVTTDDADGRDAAGAITAEVAKSGTRVLATALFTDTAGARAAVNAALDRDPQALLVSAFPDPADAVAGAARRSGFTGRIFFTSVAAGDLFLNASAVPAVDDVVMAAPQSLVIDDVIATTPAKTARKDWFDAYTSRYGQFSGYSTYAADAVTAIVTAQRDIDGAALPGGDRDRLRDAIESSQFDGMSGPVRFTPENHSGVTPQAVTLVIARDGRWRLLG